MEPADGDIDAELAKPARKVHRARILVGLHTDQPDQSATSLSYVARDTRRPNAGILVSP